MTPTTTGASCHSLSITYQRVVGEHTTRATTVEVVTRVRVILDGARITACRWGIWRRLGHSGHSFKARIDGCVPHQDDAVARLSFCGRKDRRAPSTWHTLNHTWSRRSGKNGVGNIARISFRSLGQHA